MDQNSDSGIFKYAPSVQPPGYTRLVPALTPEEQAEYDFMAELKTSERVCLNLGYDVAHRIIRLTEVPKETTAFQALAKDINRFFDGLIELGSLRKAADEKKQAKEEQTK